MSKQIYSHRLVVQNSGSAILYITCNDNFSIHMLLGSKEPCNFSIRDGKLYCAKQNVYLPLVCDKEIIYTLHIKEEYQKYLDAFANVNESLKKRHLYCKDDRNEISETYWLYTNEDLHSVLMQRGRKYTFTNNSKFTIINGKIIKNKISLKFNLSFHYIYKVILPEYPKLYNLIKKEFLDLKCWFSSRYEYEIDNYKDLVDIINEIKSFNEDIYGRRLYYYDEKRGVILYFTFLSRYNKNITDDRNNDHKNTLLFGSYMDALVYHSSLII